MKKERTNFSFWADLNFAQDTTGILKQLVEVKDKMRDFEEAVRVLHNIVNPTNEVKIEIKEDKE